MTSTAHRTTVARGQLVRLVVVLALLVGFVVGLQCTGGMATGMAMAHATTAACDSPVGSDAAPDGVGQCARHAMAFAAADDVSGLDGLGGVLATCLAFFIAVLAVATALRPGRLRSFARSLRHAPAQVLRAIRPRPVSLAELCLLRT